MAQNRKWTRCLHRDRNARLNQARVGAQVSVLADYRSGDMVERTPPPRVPLRDSRGQEISLPRVSILEPKCEEGQP